jgi:hypothetical protein
VKWGETQQRHYDRIGSKRTGKRWATAILHKLAMIQWDLWEFRNGILHAPAGPLAVAKHTFLNSLIGEDFTRGKDGIDKHYYYLFKGDNTLDNLQAADIITKQQWLQPLLSARQDYEPPEAAITKESRLRRHMHEYLVDIGVRDTNTVYTTPGPSNAPTADEPTISEEYLQDAMGEWLKKESTTTTKKQRNTNNDTIDMTNTDSEQDKDLDSENEQIYKPSKNPTKERQSDSFRNITPNRLPNQICDTQRRHFQNLPIQRKTYITKQNKTTTTYLQRQISGWLL